MHPKSKDVYTKDNDNAFEVVSRFSVSILCHLWTVRLQIVSILNQLVYFLQMCLL